MSDAAMMIPVAISSHRLLPAATGEGRCTDMESPDKDSPAETMRYHLELVAAGVCAGLCMLLPIRPAHATESQAIDMPTLHSAARASMKSLRDPVLATGALACGTPCSLPGRRALSVDDSPIQMGETSAFAMINERRELRFKWRGSREGFPEQSLKLRVSRNRSALTWEGRF